MNEEIYNQTNIDRDKLFNSIGTLDNDVFAHLVNPTFTGVAKWPSLREAFSIIRNYKDNSIIIQSTGLSDPFEDKNEANNGFRLEIFAETKDNLGDNIKGSWLFELVYSVSQEAAYNGNLYNFIKKYGVITMELEIAHRSLKYLQSENGTVGVMLGIEHPKRVKKVKFPAEEIFFISIQVLTPDELELCIEKREEGRKYLHKLMQKYQLFHYIELNRKSLINLEKEPNIKQEDIEKSYWWKFW